MPTFNKFVAFCIHTKNHQKMRDFYEKLLDFKPQIENGDFVSYTLASVNIALIGNETINAMCGKEVFSSTLKSSHLIALEVNNLNEAINFLKGKKVKILNEPSFTPWGQHVAYIADPEGNVIELSEPYEEK